ncbi:VOC family protein [Mycobacterium sp. ITM-2016-00317]|uniref:VOC family protein n=1 Tax=Mycobacterium sp. ITM-2016-00317 TaxID=2099694 RepID=UPI00287FCE7E|nr:VOC family protein [Mycobacterium sp. ITM-2016-00317]WNG85402.1 VOC family protein [Mycobacterium sp. ITM-2016-00317]
MSVHLGAVVVEAQDPTRVGRFWSALLACPTDEVDLGHGLVLDVVHRSHAEKTKNRLHLDLASVSEEHQEALVRRACALGGRPIDIGQGSVPWVVLADPEGNEFCVLEPRDEYRGSDRVAAVVTDVSDPAAVCRFWSEIIEYPVVRRYSEYSSLRCGSGPALEFVRSPDMPPSQGRLHLRLDGMPDALRDSGLSQAGESCPICGPPSLALTDPEGNHFCVAPGAGGLSGKSTP